MSFRRIGHWGFAQMFSKSAIERMNVSQTDEFWATCERYLEAEARFSSIPPRLCGGCRRPPLDCICDSLADAR